MRPKICLLFISFLLLMSKGFGQCLQRDSLWNELVSLSKSTIPAEKQLEILLPIAKSIESCDYKNDSTHALLLRRISGLYYRLSDFLSATQYLKQSIKIITSNSGKPTVDPKQLVSSYYYLSRFWDSLNNFSEKMRALDSCSFYSRKYNIIDLSSLSALYARLEYYYNVGDYNRCINYAETCETLGREYAMNGAGQDYDAGSHYASSSLAWNVYALLALKKYEAAENLLASRMDKYKGLDLKFNFGSIYVQQAEVQIHKNNFDKALLFLNQALVYERKNGDIIACKTILNNIGNDIFFNHYHNDEKALHYFRLALNQNSNDPSLETLNSIESLSINNKIANLYARKKNFNSAFKYFQYAFDEIKPGANELEILETSLEKFVSLGRVNYLIPLLIDKGDAYQNKYNATGEINAIKEAVRIYRIADKFLDRIKLLQTDLKSKLFWRSDSRRLYDHAIAACYDYGNSADAFYFFEKSRAVLLNDQLNEQNWLGSEDILKRTQLNKKMLQLEKELNISGNSPDRLKDLRNELLTDKEKLDSLNDIIKSNNPLYYQSFLDQYQLSVQDVQKKLLFDFRGLIEIFNGDSAVYTLIISPEKVWLTKINKKEYDSTVSEFIKYLSDPDLLNRNFEIFVRNSKNLNQLIFQNIVLPDGRIIVSPDGQYFPFEAIVTNDQPLSYFVEKYAISYTYSARYLLNKFVAPSNNASKDFLGIAPVNYSRSLQLPSLPGSDNSLDKLKSIYNNAGNFIGNPASKSNFVRNFSDYRIIQLFTHGFDSSNNGDPVIFFCDSALYLSELMPEKKPSTRLVILSACETGKGKLYQGEGVFSFNRGFAAIGVPSALSNLWSTDSKATFQLTEIFHRYIAKGIPLDIALQKSKIEFMQINLGENKLPYYWAATILVGKTDSIEFAKAFPWKLTAFILSVIILLLGGYLISIKSRKNKI